MALPVPTSSPCPEPEVLSQYVQGVLDEAAAEGVARHLDFCTRCQERVDGLACQDNLLTILRRPGAPAPAPDPSELARLLDRVERAGPQATDTSTVPDKPRTTETVALPAFVSCLRKSGLLESGEIERLVEAGRPATGVELARTLVARRKLTPFQAQVLLRGRWRGLVLGNYVVLDKLGQGGMSTVYKARHRRMGRVVCLKVPHSAGRRSPALLERFHREARTAAALAHPHIVVAHDAGEAEGIPFLVMEFVEGHDLARLVAARGPLPPDEVMALVLQVARALSYAHGQGVIHRDIKPHNLLVDESGAVKILDLGLARFDTFLTPHPDATTHASMTATGVIMGTVDYMAPEQALNGRLADHRSDIYSLGCTLYFLLTGRVLYSGETLMEKLIAHREQAVPRLVSADANVSPGLDAVFRHMVAKDPARRYQSMNALVQDLEAVRAGREPKAGSPATPELEPAPPRRPIRLAQMAIAGTAIAVAVSGAVLIRSAWSRPESDPPRSPAPPTVIAPPLRPAPTLVGHPQTRANGGPGRVLIVLPHDWFYEDHYTALTQALTSRGITIATASSRAGPAKPKHGEIPPVAVDLTLDTFDVNDFDAVVFLGGNATEFTHKNPKTSEQVRRIIWECLDRGRAVAAIDNGSSILDDAGVTRDCDFRQSEGCAIGRPNGKAGVLVTTRESKQAAALVQTMFDSLGADTSPPN